jgi:hypothetical protein
MRQPIRLALTALAGLGLAACASGGGGGDNGRLGWMVGCWQSADEANRETWSAPLGGVMFGHAGTMRDGSLAFFEQTRIDMRSLRAVYTVAPNGQRPAEFVEQPGLAPADPRDEAAEEIVFANPQHDYPQRIAYRRTRDGLAATISLMDGGRPVEYAWTRC